MKNEDINPFYLVLCENDGRLVRHTTIESAFSEADQLAKKEGNRFFILKTKYIVVPLCKSEINPVKPFERIYFLG